MNKRLIAVILIGLVMVFGGFADAQMQGGPMAQRIIEGPGAAVTDNALIRWDGTSGRRAQNSLFTVGDTGNLVLGSGSATSMTWTIQTTGTDPVFTFSDGSVDLTTGTFKQGGVALNYNFGTLAAPSAVTLTTDNYVPWVVNLESQANPASAVTMSGIYSRVANKATVDQANLQLVGILSRVAMKDNLTDAYGIQSHLAISAGASSSGNMTAVSGKTTISDSIAAGIPTAGLFTIDGGAFHPTNAYGVWIDVVDVTVTSGLEINCNGGTCESGIKIDKMGAGAVTKDITLQNGETIDNATDGTVKVTGDLSVTGNATISGLTASLPVFTDANKVLISKSVSDTLTALGIGTAGLISVDNALPWIIDLDVFHTPSAQTNFAQEQQDNTEFYSGHKYSTGAQNALISWDVVLAAGTWMVELRFKKDVDAGIYSVQLDTVEKGTIDSYAASPAINQLASVASITVATTGKVVLTLKMATKHASSTNYYGYIQHVRLIRTA